MKEPIYCWHFIIKDSCCLVHFSSNISCVHPHRLALLWLDEKKVITRHSEVHSKKILLLNMPSFRLSCDYNAWQSEWGFTHRMITMNYVSIEWEQISVTPAVYWWYS
jgi:hypothetical protein